MKIGSWIKRKRAGAKWHVVESVINDDAVTKCGRHMDVRREFTDISEVEPLTRMIGQPQLCKRCA